MTKHMLDAPAMPGRRRLLRAATAWPVAALAGCEARQEARPRSFKLAASVYVGWMPWMFAAEKGLLAAAGKAHGVDVSLVRGSYVESIDQFMSGHVDAVVMTNIDALAVLPGSGVQADVILVGSYSQGNDAVLLRRGEAADLRGKQVGLVENSVSHYLLERYLQTQSIPVDAVKVVNVPDSDLARAFSAPGSALNAVVTWNPIVGDLVNRVSAVPAFDSAKVPKEIADMLVVRREVLDRNPAFGQALLGTWFDTMKLLRGDATRASTLKALARLSESTVAGYQEQLGTTLLVDRPDAALQELQDRALSATMQRVEDFVRRRGAVQAPPPGPWASQDSETRALLHFNTAPVRRWLQESA